MEKSLSGKFLFKPFFFLRYFIQGGIILLASLYLFDMVFLNIVLITFSSLILTEFLNVYSEVYD